ncbi:MAG: GYD domain-containing protein [Armatimonadetes bacterium]|nr:GYD domain-containing protein [Armatimonadota bacterium]
MARFIALMRFTDQGIRAVKDSPRRAAANRALAEQVGVRVVDIFWTLGSYDVVMILEAPDDETVTSYLLSVASRGNVTTETLRAFDAEQFAAVTAKMA